MNRSARLVLFALGAAGLGALFAWSYLGLRDFGSTRSVYADAVNASSVPRRQLSEAVGAVTFDFRGVDTLIEELILLTAAVGVAVLLRSLREEAAADEAPVERTDPIAPTSEAVRFWGIALVAPILLEGLALAAHGHVTPGGGFQAGVVLASGFALVYVAGSHEAFESALPSQLFEPAESLGASAYLGMGLAALAVSGAFLENILPFGSAGQIASGGMLPLLNTAVALEVTAGVLVVLGEYLRQVMVVPQRGDK